MCCFAIHFKLFAFLKSGFLTAANTSKNKHLLTRVRDTGCRHVEFTSIVTSQPDFFLIFFMDRIKCLFSAVEDSRLILFLHTEPTRSFSVQIWAKFTESFKTRLFVDRDGIIALFLDRPNFLAMWRSECPSFERILPRGLFFNINLFGSCHF